MFDRKRWECMSAHSQALSEQASSLPYVIMKGMGCLGEWAEGQTTNLLSRVGNGYECRVYG